MIGGEKHPVEMRPNDFYLWMVQEIAGTSLCDACVATS